jgi:hypothetical protein
MIDSERRKKLAYHLRHLSVGLISNDEFENNILEEVTNGWLPEQYYRTEEAKFDDPIIIPMLELCWGLYDDTRNHKLKGYDKLSPESLKIIARCILFLQTNREYEWPYFDTKNPLFKFSFKEVVVSILTLGKYYRDRRKQHNEAYIEFTKLGNFEIWPFKNILEFENQLKFQPFLNGA